MLSTAPYSAKCGSCWKLQYGDNEPVYMPAVDNAQHFQLGQVAFGEFAGQKGFDQGSVEAWVEEVDPTHCGLWSY